MSFTVVWVPVAEDAYVEIWRQSNDHAAIWSAAQEIERQLESDPLEAGESRPEGRRILLSSPLAVIFRVDELKRRVRVLAVWRTDRRRNK